MSDLKAIVGVDIDTTIKQINEDLKTKIEPKLKPLSITLLEITDAAIKKYIDSIQRIVDQQKAIKIKTELELDSSSSKLKPADLSKVEAEASQSSKRLKEIYSNISKEISDKIAETFGITDKKALKELNQLSTEWLKLSDSMGKSNIENDIFEKAYESIKKFDSIISETQDDYVELMKVVNNSKLKAEPFGKDYENEIRKKFGVGVLNSKSGIPMDTFYQEAREQFGHILPDVDNIEDQVHAVLDALEYGRNSLKAKTITDDEIESYFGGPDGIKNAISEILGQINIANQEISNAKIELPKIEMDSTNGKDIESYIDNIEEKLHGLKDSDIKVTGSDLIDFNDGSESVKQEVDSILDVLQSAQNKIANVVTEQKASLFSSEGLDTAQTRLEEIRRTVDSLAQMRITAEVNENGVEDIVKAVLVYNTEAGNAVTETMRWVSAVNELNGEETNTFRTVNTNYTDNIAKQRDEILKVIDAQESLSQLLDNLGKGNFGEADIQHFTKLSDEVQALNTHSIDAKDKLSAIGKEISDIVARRDKLGNVIDAGGLDYKSSHEDIARYIAALKEVNAEQVQVAESGKSITTNKATGEQIRTLTLAVEESKGQFREYAVSVSSLTNEFRELDKGIVNVHSNLAQKENVLMARLQSQISTFQADMGTKIGNLKLGDLSDVDIDTLNKLQSEIGEITIKTEDAEQKMKKLGIAFKELSENIKRGKLVDHNPVDINIKSSNEELQKYISNLKGVDAENVKIESSSRLAFGRNSEQIRVVNALVADGAGGWNKYEYAINSASNQVRELDKGVQHVSESSNNLGQNMTKVAEQFTALMGAMALRFVENALKDSLGELKDIDSELVQLSKVTSLVREDFREATIEALDMGSKWGRTGVDFLQGAEAFAKAGKANYKELSELALIAQSAGDMTSTLTNEWLIASDAAFKYGENIEALTALLDGQNQISNRSAVEMRDLAEGTKEFASMAALSGETEKTMTALITAGVATTKKSGHEIGNALESITMRIRRVKGETKDGDIIDEKAISKADEALQSIGIRTLEIKDGVKQLRTVSSVIEELADKLHSGAINSMQFSKILQDVGGLHHGNTFAAIVDGIDIYRKALDDFENSMGSASGEAGKELDSWQSKLNILSNTFAKFTANLVDTELIKGSLDGVNDVFEVLSKIAELSDTSGGKGLLSFIAGSKFPMAQKRGNVA